MCRTASEPSDTRSGGGISSTRNSAGSAVAGKIMSLLDFWKGSSTNLLDVVKPSSAINQGVHDDFIKFLGSGPRAENTVCVFEAVKESILSMSIMHVSALSLI